MSKMGQELEKRLDENKYELYEALIDLVSYLEYMSVPEDCEDKYNHALRAIAKVEGK